MYKISALAFHGLEELQMSYYHENQECLNATKTLTKHLSHFLLSWLLTAIKIKTVPADVGNNKQQNLSHLNPNAIGASTQINCSHWSRGL
jgi:hypothetical protein